MKNYALSEQAHIPIYSNKNRVIDITADRVASLPETLFAKTKIAQTEVGFYESRLYCFGLRPSLHNAEMDASMIDIV